MSTRTKHLAAAMAHAPVKPPKPSEGTASAQRINAAPIAHRCDFGGICARAHGAQCAELCRRMRGDK